MRAGCALPGATGHGPFAPTNVAGFNYWPELLAKLLAGSLPGIWLGARLITRTPERLIRGVLSVLLAWAGTKLVMI